MVTVSVSDGRWWVVCLRQVDRRVPSGHIAHLGVCTISRMTHRQLVLSDEPRGLTIRRLNFKGLYFVIINWVEDFTIAIPGWIPVALFVPYPTVAFMRGPIRRYRRRKRGLCVRCGYDLTGNVRGVCPECGMRIVQVKAWLFLEMRLFPSADTRRRAWRRAEIRASRTWQFWILAGLVFVSCLGWAAVPGLLVVSVLLAASWMWLLRRTIRRSLREDLNLCGLSLCLVCGYDLTGNVSGVCPECGELTCQ